MTDRASDSGAVREGGERERALADVAFDAIIELDGAWRITEWNAPAELTFGWQRAEALGMASSLLVPLRNRHLYEEDLQRLTSGDRAVKRRAITALHKDGHEFRIEIATTALRRGDQTYIVAQARDITASSQAEASASSSSSTTSPSTASLP